MRKIILGFLAIVMVASFSTKVTAQTTNTDAASSDAFATIVAPIGIVNTKALQFGTLIAGAGTVTVDVADGRTFSENAMNPGDQGATPTSAVFAVTGEKAYTYSVAFTNSTETLTGALAGTMSAGSFLASTSAGVGLVGTLDASGNDGISVGATLTVIGDEAADVYTGSFEVTVAYN